MSENSYVIVQIGNQHYGFATNYVKEIFNYTGVTVYPYLPNYIEGVFKYRNRVIPMVNLPIILGMPVQERKRTKTVVFEFEEGRCCATSVEAVIQMSQVELDLVQDVPFVNQDKAQDLYDGVIHLEGQVITILDLYSIFKDTLINTQLVKRAVKDVLIGDKKKYTIFHINNHCFGIPTQRIKKICDTDENTDLKDIEIIDGFEMLGESNNSRSESNIIILETANSGTKGLCVREIKQTLEITDDKKQPISRVVSNRTNEFITDFVLIDKKIILLIDVEKLHLS